MTNAVAEQGLHSCTLQQDEHLTAVSTVNVAARLSAVDAAQSIVGCISWSRLAHTNKIPWKKGFSTSAVHYKIVLVIDSESAWPLLKSSVLPTFSTHGLGAIVSIEFFRAIMWHLSLQVVLGALHIDFHDKHVFAEQSHTHYQWDTSDRVLHVI